MSETAPRRRLPWWMRWLHTYASMIAFGATLFFAVTGLTLNHADLFESGEPTVRALDGTLDAATLRGEPDKLVIAETLRRVHRLRGTVAEFAVEDDECFVLWKGPGYSADVTIERATGSYHLEESRRGVMAILDDLHKGRDSGGTWSWVIDVSAVMLTLLSVTGLWLLFYLKKRRRAGLVVGFVGGMLVTMCYVFGVR
ncbi:MAG: PepSY-associated TM helix domain-containing protein [Planctomycetes bacterium]|nr:PepSY-associated TM helix domain-containing protein [Planctomycetota bacterium]